MIQFYYHTNGKTVVMKNSCYFVSLLSHHHNNAPLVTNFVISTLWAC